MVTGVLEASGRHAARGDGLVSFGMIFGERIDLPSVAALKFLDKAVHSPPSSFSYGEVFDESRVAALRYGSERYRYGTLGAARIQAFYTEVNKLQSQRWYDRAVVAVNAILDVVDSPEDTEQLALQVPFDEWERAQAGGAQSPLPLFAGWVRQIVDAYDDPDGEQAHLVRDDSRDSNADQFGALGTRVWLGTGKAPVFVFEESAIREDQDGTPRLMKELWIAKRGSAEEVQRLLNRHSLVERERIKRLLRKCDPPASEEEERYVLWYGDRQGVRRDQHARDWLEWLRAPASPTRWQRAVRAAEAMLDWVADTRPVRSLFGWETLKEKDNL